VSGTTAVVCRIRCRGRWNRCCRESAQVLKLVEPLLSHVGTNAVVSRIGCRGVGTSAVVCRNACCRRSARVRECVGTVAGCVRMVRLDRGSRCGESAEGGAGFLRVLVDRYRDSVVGPGFNPRRLRDRQWPVTTGFCPVLSRGFWKAVFSADGCHVRPGTGATTPRLRGEIDHLHR
jgi:hypothetical protein